MSTCLDPEAYDRLEDQGAAILPNRIVECCQPVGFQYEGYPTRVRSMKGVGRFVDVMHEGRLAGAFAQILGGTVTAEEMDLMREVARIVRHLTKEQYGRAHVPKDALARGLNIYRHVRFLYPNGKATVLELGGGSGYVGAMLSLAGYTYVATDIAQAFYLFQNHLMNAVTPGRVIELATDSRSFADLKEIQQGWAVHVPWWKFVVPGPDFPLAVDLVTANHCLCEMHPRALAYSLKTSASMLANRGAESCFLFEGWGSTTRNPIWSVSKKFSDLGYGIAHNDTRASVYVRTDSRLAASGVVFPRPQPTQSSCISSHHKEHRMVSLFARILPGSTRAVSETEFQGMAESSMEDLYHPPIWITSVNPISKSVVEGRERLAREAKYGVEEFEAMLREVLGNPDILTDDEKFLRYVDTTL